ncbi:hypothetical protein [Candidatus Albibeggiatoa sp. nov. NOAA]|uniref:hypothetical protein n=1 Tax=Candidatus Albibeggiatoa sp. nov. NOAA TaxID=3162724 RepID=UPI0032F4CAFF|nr:hypothetical protein [Thiotrichaceae bacterium]
MAQALSALYNLLDRQIKQGESERALTEFVFTLERKYEKQQTFICSLECNNQTRPNGPDGNCLFNALSLTLVGNESYAMPLRLMACII